MTSTLRFLFTKPKAPRVRYAYNAPKLTAREIDRYKQVRTFPKRLKSVLTKQETPLVYTVALPNTIGQDESNREFALRIRLMAEYEDEIWAA